MANRSNATINQTLNYLLNKVNNTPSGSQNLSQVLTIGNSAGTSDIDMNNNDITNVNNITATTLTGTASNASQVALTSDNTNGNYWITYSKTTTANNNTLFIDNVSGPLSYNPSNSTLTTTNIISSIQLPTSLNSATFSGTTLTANFGSPQASFRNYRVDITGTTNTISILNFSGAINNGVYNITISNSGTGNLIINNSFTPTTTYLTTNYPILTIPTGENALLTIRRITFVSVGEVYIIDATSIGSSGPVYQTLAQTLLSGNSAGSSDINMNQNDITEVLNISNSSNDLNLSATGVNNISMNAGGYFNLNATGPSYINGSALELNSSSNVNFTCPTGAYFSTNPLIPFAGDARIYGSATKVSVTNSSAGSGTYYPIFVNGSGNNKDLGLDTLFSFNISTNTLNCPNIILTDGTTTNTINNIGYTTRNTTANLTHYLNFSDSSSTGTGAIQKCAGITCNPSTNDITATTFTGNASNAVQVSLASDNTNGTYWIPFSKTTTANNNALYIDNITTPGMSYNPSTSTLGVININASIALPIDAGTATFAGTTLTTNFGTTASLRAFKLTITGTTNTINTLAFTNGLVNGRYTLTISNSGTGDLTISGTFSPSTTYLTTDNTALTIAAGGKALMIIRRLEFATTTQYVIDKYQLF